MIVSVLTCALFYSMCDLKVAQMNMQHSLIWELTLYEFKLSHKAVEATKNIHCEKGESVFDHITVTRWLKKFHSGLKNHDD